MHEQNRFEAALASYDRALMIRPGYGHGAVAIAAARCNSWTAYLDALASYDRALALAPDHAEALSNRGVTLHRLGRFEEALASYDRALAVRPDYAQALCNRGVTLHEMRRFDQALASYAGALAVRPDYAEAHNNLGNTFGQLRKIDEAVGAYRRAIANSPNYAKAHYGLSLCLLSLGDLRQGFEEYRWRRKLPDFPEKMPAPSCPLWEGESLSGKAILVHCEQGYGDSLHFIRFIRPLSRMAARVFSPLGRSPAYFAQSRILKSPSSMPMPSTTTMSR